jgi:formate dehydrogenase maturation protein FdhE
MGEIVAVAPKVKVNQVESTAVAERPAPAPRSESREIVELRQLAAEHPDLGDAAELQIELLQVQRRIMPRVPLPSIRLETDYLNARLGSGGPILDFEHLKIDWSDVRFLLRAVAAAMRTRETIEDRDVRRVEALCRDADGLSAGVRAWYEAGKANAAPLEGVFEGLEPVLLQAMRPFLMRAADAIAARTDFAGWTGGTCPLCGAEPDLAVITPAADRVLICSRCTARWRFHQLTCPFCLNSDRTQITSFTSRDGRYRLYACDVCTRYLKAYDARQASRPVLPPVDSVATLPLDAAAIQRGYK